MVSCIICNSEFSGLSQFNKHHESCKEKYRICENDSCETGFYHKSGKKQYCSHACYHDDFKKGNYSGDKQPHYRTICFQFHKKECVICKEKIVIDVHHFDHNKQNNSPENLIPLCPNHHRYIHLKGHHKKYELIVIKYIKEKNL